MGTHTDRFSLSQRREDRGKWGILIAVFCGVLSVPTVLADWRPITLALWGASTVGAIFFIVNTYMEYKWPEQKRVSHANECNTHRQVDEGAGRNPRTSNAGDENTMLGLEEGQGEWSRSLRRDMREQEKISGTSPILATGTPEGDFTRGTNRPSVPESYVRSTVSSGSSVRSGEYRETGSGTMGRQMRKGTPVHHSDSRNENTPCVSGMPTEEEERSTCRTKMSVNRGGDAPTVDVSGSEHSSPLKKESGLTTEIMNLSTPMPESSTPSAPTMSSATNAIGKETSENTTDGSNRQSDTTVDVAPQTSEIRGRIVSEELRNWLLAESNERERVRREQQKR